MHERSIADCGLTLLYNDQFDHVNWHFGRILRILLGENGDSVAWDPDFRNLRQGRASAKATALACDLPLHFLGACTSLNYYLHKYLRTLMRF